MPDVTQFNDEKEWMAACVPKMVDEGKDQDQAVAACMTMWQKKSIEPDALKFGARNARSDQMHIDAAHESIMAARDHLVAVGASGKPRKSIDPDTLITFGAEVKALGDGKVGGYLVRFSSSTDPDLAGDFFTKQTDFGQALTADVYYQHGLDATIGKRTIGRADLKIDDVGVWAEAQLNLRDAYERALYAMVEAGKQGWSSGTAAHLVERKPAGKAHEITKWPLGLDASLTPTPAEPRNSAMTLKSYQPTMLEVEEAPQVAQENHDAQPTQTAAADQLNSNEDTTMSDEALQEIKTLLTAQAVEIAALKKVVETAPPVSDIKAAAHVEVVLDEADRPFKSLAEQFNAVKSFALSGDSRVDPRLQRIQAKAALGGQESIPSEGGFLIDPTLTSEILTPLHEVGPFTSGARKLPVGPNSNFGWINGVNETNRSTGRWGGIVGYRLAEAGSKTASKPAFRRINWELKKFAVLVYGTDELLADAAQFSTIVRMGASEELSFMANDDVLNGAGAAGPFGILQSPCLVSVDKESGQAAATILTKNLSKMWMRMTPRSKANATWFINGEVSPQLDELTIQAALGVLEPRFVNYNAGGIMTIYGRPVVVTEFNAALGTVGDIVLADLSEYLYWEKGGVQEATSIHVAFLTDETVFRLVYRCDGQPALNAALTPYKGSATQSPFVALATRA